MQAPSPLPVELSCELRAASCKRPTNVRLGSRMDVGRGVVQSWPAASPLASSEDGFRDLMHVAIHLLCFKLPT